MALPAHDRRGCLGLGVVAHYCKGEIATISGIYSVADTSCKMQAGLSEKKTCSDKETLTSDSCCKNEVVSFQEHHLKITEFASFYFFSPAILTTSLWNGFHALPIEIQEKGKLEYTFESNAPPLYKLYTQYVYYG